MQLLLVFLLSLGLTALIRYYALSRKVLDIPNERSSHTTPTARGGGLAIVLAFMLNCTVMLLNKQLEANLYFTLACSILVAIIGFCDDHAHIAARWRFLTHLLAALLVLYLLNGFPALLIPLPLSYFLGSSLLNLGWLGIFIGGFLLVWLLNLFNFMDGTDGIAASQAVFVSSVLAFYLQPLDQSLFLVALSLSAACLGFLFWNWPKASIFMGDVGSGFLGLLLAILILLAAQQSAVLLYCGLIVMGLFIVDASYTLLVRIATGQKWYAAHCSHSYQRAAKRYGHLKVLLLCWAVNIGWLLPISLLVFYYSAYALFGLIIAYLPLLLVAHYFKAGHIEV